MRKSISVVLVLLAALVLFAAVASAEEAAQKLPLTVGSKIAKLSLLDANEGKADLELGSGLTAISFFNTMCSACRQELGLLENLKKQKKDFVVAAVCVDVEGKKTLAPFREKSPYPFTFYLDPNYKAAETFGIPYTPGLVIVKNGEIVYMKGGYMNSYADEIVKIVLK